MAQDDDDFTTVLERAINADPEAGDEDGFETEPDPRPLSGGGDLDDETPAPAPRAREVEAQLARLEQLKADWAAYHAQKDAELKTAQAAYKQARIASMASDGTNDDALASAEDAALQAVLDARAEVDRARQTYHEAERQRTALAEQAPRVTEAQRTWIEAHPEYRSDPRFAEEADRLMDRLRASGMDPAHPAFYRTLDTQLRTTPRMGQNARRTPGAPAIRTDSRDREAARGEVMTRTEAKFIRQLGRDPNDKAVQAQWLQSKANTRRVAQLRGGFR